ncbi:hypothetical protein BD289DRAFT_477641 [Coniella lustricola]|uniref:Uncharacterized protein n=1 Tax=Coniella lustricola TaxID=2025994 RepID=A0A2T2ZTH0_9PEZI|nr:hypothetical protein BD289DRAFT_477641 [Coniella lustricola]
MAFIRKSLTVLLSAVASVHSLSPLPYLLVLATRKNITDPQSIALLYPSVANYTDISNYTDVIEITSGTLSAIAEDLVAGKYDSAIIYKSFATAHADTLDITEELGSPNDG